MWACMKRENHTCEVKKAKKNRLREREKSTDSGEKGNSEKPF